MYTLINQAIKNKAKPTVGQAGFRPVINWREISLKKKKNVDKQILFCIIGSGILLIAFGCAVLSLGLFVMGKECPKIWGNGNKRSCLLISNHKGSWSTAREYCSQQDGNLIDVESEEENSLLAANLSDATWIALFRAKGKTEFVSSSGSTFEYRNWLRQPPATEARDRQCVTMDRTGRWRLQTNCDQNLNIVCEYDKAYHPFVLFGPVLSLCGVFILLLSVEVCLEYRRSLKKRGGSQSEDDDDDDDDDLKPVLIASQSEDNENRRSSSKNWVFPNNKTAPEDDTALVSSDDLTLVSPSVTATNIDEEVEIYSKNPPVSDVSKSQEVIELVLSPKNLKE